MDKQARSKTNAMRALDRRSVEYEAMYYSDAIKTARGVADVLAVSPEVVFKTLVMLRNGGRAMLVMVSGDSEVDVRQLARAVGAKDVRMAPRAEAERLTGLQTGGIGALALLGKPFDVFIDDRALEHESILVNGGRRGVNLRVRTDDLIAVTRAQAVTTSPRIGVNA